MIKTFKILKMKLILHNNKIYHNIQTIIIMTKFMKLIKILFTNNYDTIPNNFIGPLPKTNFPFFIYYNPSDNLKCDNLKNKKIIKI